MLLTATTEDSSFENLGRILALESAASNALGITDIFSRLIHKSDEVLTSFVQPLKAFVSGNGSTDKLIKNVNYKAASKALQQLPFVSYQDTLVMVPEGFQGNLYDYLKFIEKVQGAVIVQTGKVIHDYEMELSVFLTNVDNRKALKTHEHFYKKVREERVDIEKQLKQYFSEKDVRSRAKLGTVCRRFGELQDLFALASQIDKSSLTKKELSNLVNSVSHACELLKLLREKLNNKELGDVSGDMAKHISEGAYEVARYVELVSVLCFASEVAVSCAASIATKFENR